MIYSLNTTIDFSKECFQNFFVKDDSDCPSSYLLNSYEFNLTKYNEDEIIKENEIMRVINNLKYYSDYSDIICLSLFFISITLIILISVYYSILFFIINMLLEIAIFLLYLFRYIKFIDLKNVFDKYKDFILEQYKYNSSNEYFPHKFFNIDGFSVALIITYIIILILYSPLFEECLIKYEYLNKDMDGKKYILFSHIFCEIVLFTTLIYLVKLRDNHKKIKYRLSNINKNWNLNPIKSINLSQNYEDENDNIKLNWKNNSIIYETLNEYNYINIFFYFFSQNNYTNAKICGKHTYGNDLYFPIEKECPINDIVITNDKYFDTNDKYTKLNLKNNSFLYYTNKKIESKIINSLLIKEKINYLDRKSYSKIDTDNKTYLLTSYYSGVNPKFLPQKNRN